MNGRQQDYLSLLYDRGNCLEYENLENIHSVPKNDKQNLSISLFNAVGEKAT